MKKYLVANVGETGRLYFVPEGDNYDGVYINSGRASVVPIFAFIEKRRDIKPLRVTNRQKKFWKLDFTNTKWSKEHFVQLSPDSEVSTYNDKARNMLNRVDRAILPKRDRQID